VVVVKPVYTVVMSKSAQKTARKVQGRTARHKNVRYHNDAYLFTGSDTKTCPVCKRPFSNRKKWASRGLWPSIVYCSKACRKKSASITEGL
jgi:hypothetical protein